MISTRNGRPKAALNTAAGRVKVRVRSGQSVTALRAVRHSLWK